jgi:hypothetical protein
MSDVRSRRSALLLLVAAVFLIDSCAPAQPPGPVQPLGPPAHDCTPGRALVQRETPVLCVDNTPGARLSVHPDRIYAWDVQKSNPGAENHLHWKTRVMPANLQIEFAAGNQCVERPVCSGSGHCSAKAKRTAKYEKCKYDVIVDGVRLDPEAIIVKCCSMEEPEGGG